MTDRIQILRERIDVLRNRPNPATPYDLTEHARLMNCTVDEAKAYFTAAHQAEIERTQRLIELLEADLAQLTKPYVAPLPKPTKPRRK
jgi:hypothetical protein